MANTPPEAPKPRHHVILLSGTHVTGKETLAFSLSKAHGCPWLKGELAHAAANFGGRSQATKGPYDYGEVFQRIWFSKMQILGLVIPDRDLDRARSTALATPATIQVPDSPYTAVITCYAMRKPARDAIRQVLLRNYIHPIFVIMQITPETLSGRTLGAEEPGLAEWIMSEKVADIEEPAPEEIEEGGDVILVDSAGSSVDGLFGEIMRRVGGRVGGCG